MANCFVPLKGGKKNKKNMNLCKLRKTHDKKQTCQK